MVDKLGVGWSYVVDQMLPLTISCVIAFLLFKKEKLFINIKRYIRSNIKVFLAISLMVLFVHGLMIGNYFMGEEPTTILFQINNNSKEVLVNGILRGYHYAIYILSYQFFTVKATLYNVVSLCLYIIASGILFIFLDQLFYKKVLPAFIGTVFFITTPAYMDMFSWQSNVSGMPLALAVGLLSLLFLNLYQRNSKFYFYILSLMFYLSMLKIGFVRLHGFIAAPLFMCLFSLSQQYSKPDIKKFVLLALPFVAIFLSYIFSVFILSDNILQRGVTVRGAPLNMEGYMSVVSMLVAYLFLPSEFAYYWYPYIKEFLLKNFFLQTTINLTQIFGFFYIGLLLIIFLVALKKIKQFWGRMTILAIIVVFSHLILTPLFLQGYSDKSLMDQRFTNTGVSNGPGIRYVFVSSFGVSILFATLTYWIMINKKRFLNKYLILVFLLFAYYSYLNIASHLAALKDINPGQSAVPNIIFSMVPKDGHKKILYSANPAVNSIDSKIGDWIHAFYKIEELKYTNSIEEVQKLIKSGRYERNDFYAFYNNPLTQTFQDISDLAKKEFYDGLIDQDKSSLNFDLRTSKVIGDNPALLVLNRGIYISGELNQRLLSPRILSMTVYKNWLPVEYPYVDGYEYKDKNQDPFPVSLWDSFLNKPLIVSLKSLDGALSVKSAGQVINQIPLEFRLKSAKETIDRELTHKEAMELSDLEKINRHYIDSPEILNTFQNSPSFNSLTMLYVCAEDSDWDKQKNSTLAVDGIWNIKEIPLNPDLLDEKIQISFTCFGGVLRKIILIGPPIPSEINVTLTY